MKNRGFILIADTFSDDPDKIERTALHVEDMQCGTVAPDDDLSAIVSVWIRESDHTLEFTRTEAKDLIEALQTIVDRYEIKPEEWEARNA